MTTNIVIRTSNWPVEVKTSDKPAEAAAATESTERVEPHTDTTVYLTQTRSITLRELPESK